MMSFREFPGRIGPRRRRRARPMYETLEVRMVPSGVVASFAVTQDWGSGFQASLSLANGRTTSVNNWTLEFDYNATIGGIWDASIVNHTGNHYIIRGAGWNNDLAAGGVVSFGFLGSPGQTTAAPANYVLNGVPLTGDAPATPSLSINDASAVEPVSGDSPMSFTVGLSSPASGTVTVDYATSDATAKAGADYQAASGTITFAPGETSKTILVPVLADQVVEGDETFAVVLSNPSGATLAKTQGVGTIKDATPTPPPPPTTGDVTFQVTNDWGSGYNGQITVKNSGATAWKSWTLQFDYAGQITSIWDAVLVSRVGDHYVIGNASYDGAVAPARR